MIGWEYEGWGLNPFIYEDQRNTNEAPLTGKLAQVFNSFAVHLFRVD